MKHIKETAAVLAPVILTGALVAGCETGQEAPEHTTGPVATSEATPGTTAPHTPESSTTTTTPHAQESTTASKNTPTSRPQTSTATPEQGSSAEHRAAVTIKIGYLAVLGTTGGSPSKLNQERFGTFQQSIDNLNEELAPGGVTLKVVNMGSTRTQLTSDQKNTIGHFDIPDGVQQSNAQDATDTAVQSFLKKENIARADEPDVFAVDLQTTNYQTPFIPGKAELNKYGDNLIMNKGTSVQVLNGQETTGKKGRIYAIEVNRPIDMEGKPDPNVLPHELIHTLSNALDRLGMRANHVEHANGMECAGMLIDPYIQGHYFKMTNKIVNKCYALPYADKSSVMGNVNPERDTVDPLSAAQELQLGVLRGKVVQIGTDKSGKYDVKLTTVKSPDKSATKFVEILLPQKGRIPMLDDDAQLQLKGRTRPAYFLELSSALNIYGDSLSDSSTVKLFYGNVDADGKPVGATYQVALGGADKKENETYDDGVPVDYAGVFASDNRFGNLKISQTATNAGKNSSTATVRIEYSRAS